MATNRKGNATKSVTTVGQATAVKVTKAVTALAKVVEELQSTNDQYDDLVQNIELKQAEMETLSKSYEETERELILVYVTTFVVSSQGDPRISDSRTFLEILEFSQ